MKSKEEQLKERFTKTKDAIRYIAELESIDLSLISDIELEEKIDNYFPLIPYPTVKIPAGVEIFRARVNKGVKPYVKTKDIYMPPASLITEYGRSNKPEERIFYGATNYRLATFEVIQNLKNSISPKSEVVFLTVGVYKTKEVLHLANIIHSPILHANRKDIFKAFEKNRGLLDSNKWMGEELVNADNLICQFFANQFTKSEIKSHFDYRISAFYSRRLNHMNRFIAPEFASEKFDGVYYPSVAMKYKGDNQSIFEDSANKKLELINAIHVTCGNLDFDKGDFTSGIMHEAESIKDGVITWKKEIYSPS